MRYIIIVLINITGLVSISQNWEDCTFNIKSRFETDVELELSVRFQQEYLIIEKDSIIQNIELMARDSLKKFDIFEMIGKERGTMNRILDSIFIKVFKQIDIKVEYVLMRSINIPGEAKILYNRFLELQQSYLEVVFKFQEKQDSLNYMLETNRNLTESETEELNTKLLILKNFDYINGIYNDQVFDLIMNN